MDKETAVEFEKLKAEQKAQGKDIEGIKEIQKEWNQLVKRVVIKAVTWLLLSGAAGVVYGWSMIPPSLRKALTELWAK